MPKEIWKSITEYEGRYEVSNLGRVRALYYKEHLRQKPKVLSITLTTTGYPRVGMTLHKKQTTYKIHNLVALYFIGPRPTNYQVNHIDMDKTNNDIANLEYVTGRENTIKAFTALPSKSKHVGVDKDNRKWRARILRKGKRWDLVRKRCECCAGKAYNLAAKHVQSNDAKFYAIVDHIKVNFNKCQCTK